MTVEQIKLGNDITEQIERIEDCIAKNKKALEATNKNDKHSGGIGWGRSNSYDVLVPLNTMQDINREIVELIHIRLTTKLQSLKIKLASI